MLRQGLPDGDGHNSTPEKHAPSLRLRLAASLTAATLAVALISGITAWLAIHNEANDYQDDILRQTATLIDPHNPPRRADLDDDNRIDIEAVARTGRYGRFLGKNPHDGYHDLRRHDRAYRAYIHTYPGGERLALIQDTESRDEIASASAGHAIAPLLLLVPILALTSLYTIHRALRPVRRLSRDIEARDKNDLSPLTDSGVPQELRGITRAMNRLLARIDSTIRREQRFIADAAHELRTPMTALTLQAERLAPHLADSTAARAQLHTLRDGIRRTSALLEQLLLLARSQHSETAAPAASHVQAVFRQVIETLLPLADAKQSDLGIASDTDATLPLPAAELYTLIKNLADNARAAAASTLTSKPAPMRPSSSLKTTAPASRQRNARACSTRFTASSAATKKVPDWDSPSSKPSATNTAQASLCTMHEAISTVCAWKSVFHARYPNPKGQA